MYMSYLMLSLGFIDFLIGDRVFLGDFTGDSTPSIGLSPQNVGFLNDLLFLGVP